jgi:hypothetical protein
VQRVVLGPAVPARQVDLVLEGLDLPRLHQVSDQQLVVSAVLVPRLQTPLPVFYFIIFILHQIMTITLTRLDYCCNYLIITSSLTAINFVLIISSSVT